MKTRRFVIGDIHGQYPAFERLLEYVNFSPDCDHLYCVGDLVNKGADSIRVVRTVRSLGPGVTTVLGNHELIVMHAAVTGDFAGLSADLRAHLRSSEGEEILAWFRTLPVLATCEDTSVVIVHAGLPPQWDMARLREEARHVENVLQGDSYENLVASRMWSREACDCVLVPETAGDALLRAKYSLAVFTLAREMNNRGVLPLGAARTRVPNAKAWFELDSHVSRSNYTVIFGHWSSLGGYKSSRIIGLDTACAKGGTLSLYDIDTGTIVREPCACSG